MAKKATKSELKAAVEDLIEVLGLEDEENEGEPAFKVTSKTSEADIKEFIEAAAGEITDDDSEEDFQEETVEVLTKLGVNPWSKTEEAEEQEETENDPEEEEEADDSLEEQITEAGSLKELKTIVKANDEFKDLRGELSKFKNHKQLAKKMMAALAPEEDNEEEEKPVKKAKVKPEAEETEEADYSELIEEIENASTLGELKELVKDNQEDVPKSFANLKGQLKGMKKTSQLREAMLKALGTEAEKPATKEKITKAKKEGPKKVGVIATIVEAIEGAGKKGISKEEILEQLVEKFPDKESDSMKRTVAVQVPGRISREKFELKKLENGNFAKK